VEDEEQTDDMEHDDEQDCITKTMTNTFTCI
jgi:hypothetical protein